MEDIFHLSNNNTQYFYNTGPNAWQVWRKTPNASTVVIFCLGGGGGGGGGESDAGINTKNGGGGGGSASYTTATFPAYLLPDELFINVGSGGTGGLSNANSLDSATLSYVSINSNSKIPQDCVCVSGTVTAKGGLGASLTTGGAGGTIATPSMAYFLKLSTYYAVAGMNGANGTVNGIGVSVTGLVSAVTCPGAGGGGGAAGTGGFAGGTVTGQGLCNYIIAPGSGITGANGTNGNDGVFMMKPFCTLGGSGGGGSGANGGGKGGNGSFGSGGGGGGGGTSPGGGAGGNGGDGLVIIVQV